MIVLNRAHNYSIRDPEKLYPLTYNLVKREPQPYYAQDQKYSMKQGTKMIPANRESDWFYNKGIRITLWKRDPGSYELTIISRRALSSLISLINNLYTHWPSKYPDLAFEVLQRVKSEQH